jgi:hypothetical protein
VGVPTLSGVEQKGERQARCRSDRVALFALLDLLEAPGVVASLPAT